MLGMGGEREQTDRETGMWKTEKEEEMSERDRDDRKRRKRVEDGGGGSGEKGERGGKRKHKRNDEQGKIQGNKQENMASPPAMAAESQVRALCPH